MQEAIPAVEVGVWQLLPELCTILWQAACCFSVPVYLNEGFGLHSCHGAVCLPLLSEVLLAPEVCAVFVQNSL